MARIEGIVEGFEKTTSGEMLLIVEIDEENVEILRKYEQKKVNLEVKLWRKARSLDANSYFHVLVDELRKVLGISFAHCKNNMITSYGQIEYLSEGVPVIYKTNAPPEYVRELEEIHLKLVKVDLDAYWYRVYRGSHTYDTKEMTQLIDGVILECKEQGVETMTPDQLKELMSHDSSNRRNQTGESKPK